MERVPGRPPAPGRRRLRAADVAVAAVVSSACLGALEVAARRLEPAEPAAPVAPYIWDWREKWDGDFYTMVSRSTGWPPSEEFNGDGVRDRTHSVEKPPRTHRLVFLGDSVTLGAGIPAEQAYPQQLQALLDERGHPLEVFNVALWGWSTRQQRIAYARIARRYAPDSVVLAVCLNDLPELQNNLSRPPDWLTALHQRSALVRWLVAARRREIRSVEELFEAPPPERVERALQRFFEEVSALAGEVRADGAHVALIVFPFRFQVQPGAPPPSVQRRILGYCEQTGLDCLDLLPSLAALGPAAFVDYDHLSPPGAALVAERLLESGLFPVGVTHRARIAGALGRGEGADRDGFVALTGDERPALREAALWELARADEAGPAEAERAATLIRSDPDPGVRARAAGMVGRLDDPPRGVELALYGALDDTSEVVRHAAARALHRIGPSRGDLERLVAALASDDRYVVGFGAWQIGELGPEAESAVPAVLAALKQQAVGEGIAAQALAKLGDAAVQAVPELVAALRAEQPRHRWNAALALGRLGPRAAAARDPLERVLSGDPDTEVRASAAKALGRIGGEESVEPLAAALDDPEGRVRAMAARALGWLGPAAAAARPRLERALEDPHRKVRRLSEQSLRSIDTGR